MTKPMGHDLRLSLRPAPLGREYLDQWRKVRANYDQRRNGLVRTGRGNRRNLERVWIPVGVRWNIIKTI